MPSRGVPTKRRRSPSQSRDYHYYYGSGGAGGSGVTSGSQRQSRGRVLISSSCSSSSSSSSSFDESDESSSRHYYYHPFRRSERLISYTRRHPLDRRRVERRDNPLPNRCLGVFGLNAITSQQKIHEIFGKFGPIERIHMVVDVQNGRSRGFCFIYYESITDACVAKSGCSGIEIDERRIRVDYSFTQRPHTPTPGVYMGPPKKSYRNKNSNNSPRNERDRPRTRSRSPRRSNRY